MVKKKRGKRISTRKTNTKRKTNTSSKKVRVTKRKFKLVLRNLILFVIMSLISSVLYYFLNEGFFKTLFLLLAIIFSFITLAFLIVFLILIILKLMKK